MEIFYDDPNDSQGVIQAAASSLFSVNLAEMKVTFPVAASLVHVGIWQAFYKVFLKDYPAVKTATLSSPLVLQILDPCDSSKLAYHGQTANFLFYPYSGAHQQLTFEKMATFVYSGFATLVLPEFTSEVAGCTLAYSCEATGPKGDSTSHMCPSTAFDDGKTKAWFNPEAKAWTFSTTDVKNANYAPGVYVLIFTATAGAHKSSKAVTVATIVLEDPCPRSLVLTDPSPLTNVTYYLQEPPKTMTWFGADLATLKTNALCGELKYDFF